MPFFTILAAATQINLRINATIFQERNAHSRETGRKRDIETAISIKIDRILAITLYSFLVSQEHRDARAVFALEEDLFADILILLEFHLRSRIERAHIAIHVVLIHSARLGKGGEGVEALRFFLVARKANAAHRREFHFMAQTAVKTINVCMIGSILLVS